MPLIQIGKSIGMQVTVLEDRPSFADNARKMGADRVLCDGFEQGLAQIPGSPSTYFVIVTRGHRYDRVCLEQILKKKRAYVGMMGSRRRVLLLKKELEATGISREELDEVHMPIGLPISAETPEEIAVSVMAEIIQCKNQKKRSEGYREEILDALQQPEEGLPVVLAEIVERKGSAPRAVGTKMVIRLDGKITGTIGGGCMEAEVIQKARQMLASENETYCMTKVDMSMEAAEDEGMVCGGTQLVYLEKRGRL
jgi:xanthine dehydrogenase accessory factor